MESGKSKNSKDKLDNESTENNRLGDLKANGSWKADGCIKYITILEYKINKSRGKDGRC
ncbi:MAG: hypothetical protein IPK10_14380 [Bacteroidetes bacterium]|nr:hypothetical protein [Bacteroidota bacterium]